ncbi:MAG TPA: hypothetical protein VFA42_05190 [Gaiellaceae bacterium]|jgi:hypothetical protein|nr:hypothetical protein [Gaiellaceae bacterium]
MRVTAVAGLVAVVLGVLAQGAGAAPATSCPSAWAHGWQRLADKVAAPVYCPTWMPNPLDAHIGGQYQDIYSIGKDRSYLVSFLEHGDLGSGDVHVNFRGYPGRTKIPQCPAPVGHTTVPCFADPAGRMSANGIHATVYQVNQGADQWHILLAWHYHGSLYTVSQHVINPYDSATRIRQNLAHLLKSLVLVQPQQG